MRFVFWYLYFNYRKFVILSEVARALCELRSRRTPKNFTCHYSLNLFKHEFSLLLHLTAPHASPNNRSDISYSKTAGSFGYGSVCPVMLNPFRS